MAAESIIRATGVAIERPDPAAISLDSDIFMRSLIRELCGTIEDVVGLKEAAGFVSVVGQKIGDHINAMYKGSLDVEKLDRPQVASALVDLKRRIGGDFYIIEQDDEKIVLGNRRCPFGENVNGRESMCMMTSNVFGSIASQNLGYSKVDLQNTIARGDAGCRVVVHLKRTPEANECEGREYFKS